MVTIAHILNPFIAEPGTDLAIAQPITFESMRIARNNAGSKVKVELWSAQFVEDRKMIPDGFLATPDLQESVLDGQHFSKQIKLPLIHEIIGNLYAHSNAEYLIYTNVDIGLQPDFYKKVGEFIDQGFDAFIINRRRIPDIFSKTGELPQIWKEKGKSHPGFDCFVFHRSLFPKFQLEKICIGVPFVEITLSQNLFAHAKNFRLFDKEHLTFHIGMEIFRKRAPGEYLDYNRTEYRKAIQKLWPFLDPSKFPYSNLPLPFRLIRWGLHPCIPIKEALKLEWEKFSGKRLPESY